MSGAVEVADLYAALRLKPDKASWASGDKLISGIKTGLKVLGGLAAVRWAKNAISDTVELGDHFDELSQQTGVNVEALQALSYAAGFSSVGTDALAQSMSFLAKNADAAARGGKTQARAFRSVGVDAKALVSGTLGAEEALGKIAGRFAKMEDGSAKQNLARNLFGKSGVKLIPFLNEGAAGLAKLTAEAKDLGIVMDSQTVKSMAAFADDQDRLSATWRGIKQQAVAALLPVLQSVATWVLKHRKQIQAFFAALGKEIKFVAKMIGVIVDKISDAVGWLADKLGITTEAIVAVGAALLVLGPIVTTVAGILAAAFTGAALPIVLIGGLIAGLILLIKNVTFDKLVGKVKDFLNGVKELAQDTWDFIRDPIGHTKRAMKVIGEAIAPALTSATEKVLDLFSGGAITRNNNTSGTQEADRKAANEALDSYLEDKRLRQEGKNIRAEVEMNIAREHAPGNITPAELAADMAANPPRITTRRNESGDVIPDNGMSMDQQVAAAEAAFNERQIRKERGLPPTVVVNSTTTITTGVDVFQLRKELKDSEERVGRQVSDAIDGGAP